MTPLSIGQLDAILEFDTCEVLNAIETFGVRLRNEGFARPGLQWMFPSLSPMLGYAATMRMKSSDPPIGGTSYSDRTDWWEDLDSIPGRKVAVIEDSDEAAGVGAVMGEVHAAVMQRLGCSGLVTNGSVRDLAAVERMGFRVCAKSVSPSHAYGHVVEHNRPVTICGLQIHPGDLLYADRHGLISIPIAIAAGIPVVAAELRDKERRILELCRSSDFSLEKLRAVLQ